MKLQNRDFSQNIDIEILAPPSKSVGQRLIFLSLLHNGRLLLKGIGNSTDEKSALEIIRKLGGEINWNCSELLIDSSNILSQQKYKLQVGESGLSARMIAMILAGEADLEVEIESKGSLSNRKITFLETFFSSLNIPHKTKKGKFPISFTGIHYPNQFELEVSESSQYISGLLFSLVRNRKNAQIILKNSVSIPYILLTNDILRNVGAKITFENETLLLEATDINIPTVISSEGCWSSAAYYLVAGALFGRAKVHGLNSFSSQADARIFEILKDFGAEIKVSKDSVEVRKKIYRPIKIDATHCPDLIPILTVLAVFALGKSEITGVNRLQNKESNRARAIENELAKIGIKTTIENNILSIEGGKIASISNEIYWKTYQDHRIAMMLAILSLGLSADFYIENPEVVNKSFPNFWEEYRRILS